MTISRVTDYETLSSGWDFDSVLVSVYYCTHYRWTHYGSKEILYTQFIYSVARKVKDILNHLGQACNEMKRSLTSMRKPASFTVQYLHLADTCSYTYPLSLVNSSIIVIAADHDKTFMTMFKKLLHMKINWLTWPGNELVCFTLYLWVLPILSSNYIHQSYQVN